MSEKRLQEIKDSIEFQVLYTEKHNFDKTLLQEEVDLYNEVIKLNNIIKEFNKLIENEINESKLEEDYDRVDAMKYCLATLRKLKGSDKE